MKIGTISDLHIDRHPKLEPQAYLDALVYIVEQRNIELLLIGEICLMIICKVTNLFKT